MKVQLNGDLVEFEPGTTVQMLLASLEIGELRVAVAVNGEVSPRTRHASRVLQHGDSVEVIQAVAGG